MDEEEFNTVAVKFIAATASFVLGMIIAQMFGF
jgi:hypothetical protein